MPHILILDDDDACRRLLAARLADRGHQVRSGPLAAIGPVLTRLVRGTRQRPDAVVLDPYGRDVDALRLVALAAVGSGRPVMVSTAPRADIDIAALLNAGADTFMAKPLSPAMCEARLRATMRRVPPPPPPSVRVVGELRVDIGAREAWLRGTRLRLTRAEFDLLAGLAQAPGRTIPRDRLLPRSRVGAPATPNTVDVLLSRLRGKLGETAGKARYLHTVRGHGVSLRQPA